MVQLKLLYLFIYRVFEIDFIKKKIHVLTVKPGFVYTKMTNHLKLSKFLTSTPQEIANEIYKAQQNKKEIIYVKSIWYWIMILIKIIPERFFKKSNL